MNDTSPAGIYVHIPFCIRRCAYCAFPSSVYDPERAEWYLTALAQELADRADGLTPETLYIGGGTPTCLENDQFRELLFLLRLFPTNGLREYTVEANPGTLNMDMLLLMRRAGVTRISLGVQSFSERGLELLGRMHSMKQARAAVAKAREVGFDEVSLDLMFGWPGQSLTDWEHDLRYALDLGIPHLSCYGLTYEPGTPLAARRAAGQIHPIDEEVDRAMFDMTEEVLAEGGLRRYEISNFAAPGHECRHNMHYWVGRPYLGVGAGACSYLNGTRATNIDDPEKYAREILTQRDAVASRERLAPERRARECAVIWLRLADGIDGMEFEKRTGYALGELFEDELPSLLEGGWLRWNGKQGLQLTPQAIPVADSILSELV